MTTKIIIAALLCGVGAFANPKSKPASDSSPPPAEETICPGCDGHIGAVAGANCPCSFTVVDISIPGRCTLQLPPEAQTLECLEFLKCAPKAQLNYVCVGGGTGTVTEDGFNDGEDPIGCGDNAVEGIRCPTLPAAGLMASILGWCDPCD